VRHDTSVSWYQAGGVFLVLGLSLAPVILNALLIFEHAQQHVIAERPTLRNFADSLHLGMIAGFAAGASLLAHWRGWVIRRWKFLPVPFALMLGWWLCQPLCLFIFSWITGNSVFVQRYLFLSLPGAAFLAVAMAAQFLPDDAWKPLSALVGIGVLIFIGNWKHILPEHQESRWREAAMAINKLPGMRPSTPIICPSPYIEAQPPAWSPAYSPAGFLYSHLQVYPLKGTIYPFPFQLSPEAESNAANLTKEILPASGLFVIYGGDRNVRNWRDWFLVRPELAGWKLGG